MDLVIPKQLRLLKDAEKQVVLQSVVRCVYQQRGGGTR